MERERGFTLVELTVATAIGAMLSWALLATLHATIFGAAHLDARLAARTSIDRLADRLTSDAATAWSVFVPNADVLGAKNADGHELDFVTQDAARRTYWRAYEFDANAKRVTIYAYTPGGNVVAGDTFESIDGFNAEEHPVTDLMDSTSDVYDPLFAGSSVTPVDFDFGWKAAATGGNHLVRVRATGSGIDRTLLLASATAPSHFTVVVEYTPAP